MYPLYICEMNSDNSKMVHTDASDCVRSLFAVLTNTNLVYVFSSQHTQSDWIHINANYVWTSLILTLDICPHFFDDFP